MEKQQDNTLAWVSYITIIGWIVAIVMYNDSQKGNSIVRYHLKQSLGLFMLYIAGFFVFAILGFVFAFVVPFMIAAIGLIANIYYLGLLVLLILGIIYAAQGQEKPLPIVGEFFDKKLTFIK